MKDFTKYELFTFKAYAVKSLAETINYRIQGAEEDKKYYEQAIEDRIADRKEEEDFDPDKDWSIRSNKESIEKDKLEIALWQKCLKLLDKEMGE